MLSYCYQDNRRLAWTKNNQKLHHGVACETWSNQTLCSYTFTPTYKDQGSSIRCKLSFFDHWNYSNPLPSCGFDDVQVSKEARVRACDLDDGGVREARASVV